MTLTKIAFLLGRNMFKPFLLGRLFKLEVHRTSHRCVVCAPSFLLVLKLILIPFFSCAIIRNIKFYNRIEN